MNNLPLFLSILILKNVNNMLEQILNDEKL